ERVECRVTLPLSSLGGARGFPRRNPFRCRAAEEIVKALPRLASWIQVAPVALILVLFFGLPMLVVVAVSFFDYGQGRLYPTFIFDNYLEIFSSSVTLRLYLSSLKFALIVWAVTLFIGFNIAYFLVFHVRTLLWQIGLFLLCTVPFWTSNI